tara:strand:- start:269 stop:436 length:168 start_codon:yes stop_codon:yes gene_type:complete
MGDNKKRTGHTDYRSLSKIADNIRKTMQEQKIQEGIDSTSPEGEDAIFIKKKKKK